MNLMQRRRALMAAAKKEEGIPGTIITIPQSCTKSDEAWTIWSSIAENNTKPGIYFTTKKGPWSENEIVCVLLSISGSIDSIQRYRSGSINVVPISSLYDCIMREGDTFYFVEVLA